MVCFLVAIHNDLRALIIFLAWSLGLMRRRAGDEKWTPYLWCLREVLELYWLVSRSNDASELSLLSMELFCSVFLSGEIYSSGFNRAICISVFEMKKQDRPGTPTRSLLGTVGVSGSDLDPANRNWRQEIGCRGHKWQFFFVILHLLFRNKDTHTINIDTNGVVIFLVDDNTLSGLGQCLFEPAT